MNHNTITELDPQNKNGGYILPQQLMREILEHACSNPYYPPGFKHKEEYRKHAENKTLVNGDVPPPGGWNEYHIDTHCMSFKVIARKKRNPRTKKYTWQILQFTVGSA